MDFSVLSFLAAPFAASLIIAGIHAYLGVHVVERGVIFVDLSLAQIAALGATIALLLPFTDQDPHGGWVYWSSLAFTLVGAAIFATIKSRRARIPQEALIGISYAVASAATILAMSKATSESEHLKDMLVGNILAVSWPEVINTAWLYAIIGVFHYVFRKRFLAISLDHEAAEGPDPDGPGESAPAPRERHAARRRRPRQLRGFLALSPPPSTPTAASARATRTCRRPPRARRGSRCRRPCGRRARSRGRTGAARPSAAGTGCPS